MNTTAKLGGLCEERSEKGRGGRKIERKCYQQGPMDFFLPKWPYRERQLDQPHPYKSEIY